MKKRDISVQIRIKPVFILSKSEGVLYHRDGTREAVTDETTLSLRVTQMSKELRKKLKFGDTLLEDSLMRNESDLVDLKMEMLKADALFLYFLGEVPLRTLLYSSLACP